MTNQEAIKRIEEHIAIHKYRESHAMHIVEALEMAISALEKQIPEIPKYKEEDRFVKNCFAWYTYCPKCRCEINTGDMYCAVCGQEIDWEEE